MTSYLSASLYSLPGIFSIHSIQQNKAELLLISISLCTLLQIVEYEIISSAPKLLAGSYDQLAGEIFYLLNPTTYPGTQVSSSPL
uniref:Uncharacterized protein n=1 Tax=Salix viminalis TaxID=40686 RepID=A0A6N2LWC3_SALVM